MIRRRDCSCYEIIWMVIDNDYLVNLAKDFICQSFPELHQEGWDKRRFRIIPGKADEVLLIWVFHELFHELSVSVSILLLDEQGTKRHAERLCRMAGPAREKLCVEFLDLIPWN